MDALRPCRKRFFSIVMALTLLAAAVCPAQELAVKEGQKIAFLGDSITAGGFASPTGYVRLVISGLKTHGVNAVPVPAGVSGHKSNDMLARLERDVISKKPDWMTLSCGVNDVWHGANGVPLDQYKTNITAIVDKTQAAGIKVMILTATMITEDQAGANNQKLIAYNAFLRELAAQKKCLLADLNAEMQAAIKARVAAGERPGNLLTADGVHMNPFGNQMMATGVLEAFGLNEAQVQKAREAWLDIPNSCDVSAKITLRQYEQLARKATAQKQSVSELLSPAVAKALESLLKSDETVSK